jgi:hypothetical protein
MGAYRWNGSECVCVRACVRACAYACGVGPMAGSCNCRNTLCVHMTWTCWLSEEILSSSHLAGWFGSFMYVNHYFLLRMTILWVGTHPNVLSLSVPITANCEMSQQDLEWGPMVTGHSDCNNTDSSSTSHQNPAPVALVSAMDGEPLGLLATEMRVPQLQMQTVQGQWWAVTVQCCTFSVHSAWHFKTKCVPKGPYYTFNDAVPTCDYCPQCNPSAVTCHDWEVHQEEFTNPADDKWSLNKYNKSVSTALSSRPKCRVYTFPLYRVVLTLKQCCVGNPEVVKLCAFVQPLFSRPPYTITCCVGNPEMVKFSAMCGPPSYPDCRALTSRPGNSVSGPRQMQNSAQNQASPQLDMLQISMHNTWPLFQYLKTTVYLCGLPVHCKCGWLDGRLH